MVHRIKGVAEEVQQHAGKFLRVKVEAAGRRVIIPAQGDVEPGILGASAVISEVQRFVDRGVEVDRPVLG